MCRVVLLLLLALCKTRELILDQPGAEKLVGQGDMLIVTASSSKAQRIQGSWVSEECVKKVTAHWRRQATELAYVSGIQDEVKGSGAGAGSDDDDSDALFEQAMELVVRAGQGSTSMLQRKVPNRLFSGGTFNGHHGTSRRGWTLRGK